MVPQRKSSRDKHQQEGDVDKMSGIVKVLDAAANETRLTLLQTLREESHTFTELAQGSGLDISADSGLLGFHLRSLTNRGLVTKRNHTYSITTLGKALLSAVRDLEEIEKEEETMGMVIEEVDTQHIQAIKEFFKEEYGVDEDWLQSVEKTYSLLVSGKHLVSEDSEILSLVALMGKKVVGFVGGRLLSKVRTDLSLSPEYEKDEEFYSWVKENFPDLETLSKMSKEDREGIVREIMSRVGITEGEVERHDWLKTFFTLGHPGAKDAWMDMIWSTQRHEHLVKKKLLKEFIERAREKGAWSLQTYLRNPEDVNLVTEAGFMKANGQLCATYIGPREIMRKFKLMYGIRLGSSPLRWDFTHDKQYQSVKLTDIIGDSEGGVGLTLDTDQLYEKSK